MLQGLAGGPQGYRLCRILLTNFWLYGQQEFEIPHGRLFLAGENASGKSTVFAELVSAMQEKGMWAYQEGITQLLAKDVEST